MFRIPPADDLLFEPDLYFGRLLLLVVGTDDVVNLGLPLSVVS